jgi:hypothetical protein
MQILWAFRCNPSRICGQCEIAKGNFTPVYASRDFAVCCFLLCKKQHGFVGRGIAFGDSACVSARRDFAVAKSRGLPHRPALRAGRAYSQAAAEAERRGEAGSHEERDTLVYRPQYIEIISGNPRIGGRKYVND